MWGFEASPSPLPLPQSEVDKWTWEEGNMMCARSLIGGQVFVSNKGLGFVSFYDDCILNFKMSFCFFINIILQSLGL
jgi:hypothetical protein